MSSVVCALFVSNAVRLRGLCLSLDMHRGFHGCASHLGRYVACLPRQIQSVFRSYGCLMLLGVQCMKQRTCMYIRNNGCDMVLLDVQIWASYTSSSIVARKMKFRLACIRTCTWADTTQVDFINCTRRHSAKVQDDVLRCFSALNGCAFFRIYCREMKVICMFRLASISSTSQSPSR